MYMDHPTIAAGAGDLLVAWQGGGVHTNGGHDTAEYNLYAARVTAAGEPLAPFTVSAAWQEQSWPAAAFNGSSWLVAWQDARTAPNLPGAAYGHFDIYAARVLASGGVAEPNGVLISSELEGAPVVTLQPVSQTNRVGETAHFLVRVAGSQPLAYHWLFNGGPIPGATQATLTMSNIQPTHAGRYTVIISNALGVVTSDTATLTVLPARGGPGSLNFSFDPTGGGQTVELYGKEVSVSAVVAQPDGRVLVGGCFDIPQSKIARLNSDGSVDMEFRARVRVNGPVFRLILQPDDKILFSGEFDVVNGHPAHDLARLNADGSFDTSFSSPIPSGSNVPLGPVMALACIFRSPA